MQTGSASSSAVIVTEDPSSKDSTTQIGADLYTVNDANFTIDGVSSTTTQLLIITLFKPVPIIKFTINLFFAQYFYWTYFAVCLDLFN